MYLLVNGGFGVGKPTVARELRSLIPDSVIVDPDWLAPSRAGMARLPGGAA